MDEEGTTKFNSKEHGNHHPVDVTWIILNDDADQFFSFLGLSCRTQEVYLLVFLVRYADLFMYYVSAYNTMMKIFFISSTAFIIYLMRFKKPFCSVSTMIFSSKLSK